MVIPRVKVIPIHKRGDKSECNNYRQISLISNTSKLIEKKQCMKDFILFLKRICYFFKDRLDLGSTADALIDITERIVEACDKGLYACGAFLDFRKAFDTMNLDILLNKLAHYGIRGQANNWFLS